MQQIKTPGRTGGSLLRNEVLLLLATLLARLLSWLLLLTRTLLSALLSGLLAGLLPRLLLLTRILLILLATLILSILAHSYLQFIVKYCLNVIIQPTHSSYATMQSKLGLLKKKLGGQFVAQPWLGMRRQPHPQMHRLPR